MAIAPNDPQAFLREVDEELRRDRFEHMWRRYGRAALIGVAVLLALVAGFLFWQHRRNEQRGIASEQLSQALADLSEGKRRAATAKLAELKGANGSYAALGAMAAASLSSERNEEKAALAGFRAVRDDGSAPQPIRDIARIRAAALAFDSAPPLQIVAELKDLAVAGNPFFGAAGELTALAYVKLGRGKDASRLLRAVGRDQTVPESLRERAARLADSLDLPASAAPRPPVSPKP